MLDTDKMSTEELREIQKQISDVLAERQKALQEICEHPEFIDIMYMRPGAFYRGCKVCQLADPDYSRAVRAETTVQSGFFADTDWEFVKKKLEENDPRDSYELPEQFNKRIESALNKRLRLNE